MVEIEPPFEGDGGLLISGYFRHLTTYCNWTAYA